VLLYFVKPEQRRRYFFALLFLPVPLLLFLAGTNGAGFYVSLIASFLVFLSIGSTLVLVFQQTGCSIAHLYALDLTGAALGSVSCFLLLNVLGAVHALFLFALILTAAFALVQSVVFSPGRKLVIIPVILLALITAGFFLDLQSRLLPQDRWEKEMTLLLRDGRENPRIVESRWSAFGRADLVESDNPLFKTIFVDGGAGTKMIQMENGRVVKALADNLMYVYMGGLPLLAVADERRGSALVLGSGGGIDVVTLLLWDYQEITAVEINPDFIDIVEDWGQYNGNIYNDHPRVRLVEGEGRSYLRNTSEKFDLILMSLPIIKSFRNYGNQQLVENYLFTREAFGEYRRALAPGGQLIVVTHYRNELLRLVANALKSFEDDGVSPPEAMQKIAAIGSDANPTLILKNGVIDETEVGTYYVILDRFSQRGRTNFIPFIRQRTIEARDAATGEIVSLPEFHPGLYDLSRGRLDLDGFIENADENISWVSDDSPFFYQLSWSLPREIVVVLLVGAALLAGVFAVFSVAVPRADAGNRSRRWLYFIAFAALGLGFILTEIGVLQRYILLWEHQTLALSAVLAVILVSSGLGSYVSGWIKSRTSIAAIVLAVVVISLPIALVAGRILPDLSGATAGVKILATILGVGPLFFCMGMPFPWTLRRLSEQQAGRRLFPWMMGINSITTLLGGALSLAIALDLGFRFVLFVGSLAYLCFIGISLGGMRPSGRRLPPGD
jgi:spermidine synthase